MVAVTAPLKIVVTGADGKMGQALVAAISADKKTRLAGALVRPESPLWHQDAGQKLGITTSIRVEDETAIVMKMAAPDVVIDFTRPEATLFYLHFCLEHHIAMVIGTTGFTAAEKETITRASESIPIVFSPNFSIGVNLAFALTAMAARILPADYDTEIIEAHHRHKVDAPSGTALRLGEVVASAKNLDFAEVAVFDRHGDTGPRRKNEIGFATVRGGDIVGDHTVLFAGEGERIEITHKASSRLTFAKGAVAAAQWVKGKNPGLYSMQDVLNLPL